MGRAHTPRAGRDASGRGRRPPRATAMAVAFGRPRSRSIYPRIDLRGRSRQRDALGRRRQKREILDGNLADWAVVVAIIGRLRRVGAMIALMRGAGLKRHLRHNAAAGD